MGARGSWAACKGALLRMENMSTMRRTAIVAGVFYLATVLALPVFAWEVSFAIWLIVKGFRPSTITAVRSPEVEGHTPLPLG
jgi:hypothetical protein